MVRREREKLNSWVAKREGKKKRMQIFLHFYHRARTKELGCNKFVSGRTIGREE